MKKILCAVIFLSLILSAYGGVINPPTSIGGYVTVPEWQSSNATLQAQMNAKSNLVQGVSIYSSSGNYKRYYTNDLTTALNDVLTGETIMLGPGHFDADGYIPVPSVPLGFSMVGCGPHVTIVDSADSGFILQNAGTYNICSLSITGNVPIYVTADNIILNIADCYVFSGTGDPETDYAILDTGSEEGGCIFNLMYSHLDGIITNYDSSCVLTGMYYNIEGPIDPDIQIADWILYARLMPARDDIDFGSLANPIRKAYFAPESINIGGIDFTSNQLATLTGADTNNPYPIYVPAIPTNDLQATSKYYVDLQIGGSSNGVMDYVNARDIAYSNSLVGIQNGSNYAIQVQVTHLETTTVDIVSWQSSNQTLQAQITVLETNTPTLSQWQGSNSTLQGQITVVETQKVSHTELAAYPSIGVTNLQILGQAYGSTNVITYTSTNVLYDCDNGNMALVILTNDVRIGLDNAELWTSYALQIVQDGTGSRSACWDSAIQWGAAGDPSLSTGADEKDIVYFAIFGSTNDVIGQAGVVITGLASIAYVDAADSAQDVTISGIISTNTSQDNSIAGLNSTNTTQANQIAGLILTNTSQDTLISGIIITNTSQDTLISGIITTNTAQDNSISGLNSTNTTQANQIAGLILTNTTQDTNISGLITTNTFQGNQIGSNENDIASLMIKDMTIYQPDVAATKCKYARVMYVDDASYPQGITVTDVRYDLATNTVTYVFALKSMTDLNGTGVSTIYSCTATNVWSLEHTGLSANVVSNVILVLELPSTDVEEIGATWKYSIRK